MNNPSSNNTLSRATGFDSPRFVNMSSAVSTRTAKSEPFACSTRASRVSDESQKVPCDQTVTSASYSSPTCSASAMGNPSVDEPMNSRGFLLVLSGATTACSTGGEFDGPSGARVEIAAASATTGAPDACSTTPTS